MLNINIISGKNIIKIIPNIPPSKKNHFNFS